MKKWRKTPSEIKARIKKNIRDKSREADLTWNWWRAGRARRWWVASRHVVDVCRFKSARNIVDCTVKRRCWTGKGTQHQECLPTRIGDTKQFLQMKLQKHAICPFLVPSYLSPHHSLKHQKLIVKSRLNW